MNEYFVIGKIVNTHALKGELKVVPITDDINRFKKLKKVLVVNKTEFELNIERVWFNKKFVIIKFFDIDDINSAQELKNSILKVNRKDAIKLNKDEYFINDIYGLEVFENEKFLGVIEDIIFTGANDVYVVKNFEDNKEILIPAIKQCILNVDIKNKKMQVKLLKGL